MNQIQNKLPSADMRGPSTKNFQQQQHLREKNYQSDTIKMSLSQQNQPYVQKVNPQRNPEVPSMSASGLGEKLIRNQMQQYSSFSDSKKQSLDYAAIGQTNNNFSSSRQSQSQIVREEAQKMVGSHPQIVKISQRSHMYDFRKISSDRRNFMNEAQMNASPSNSQNMPSSSQLKQQLSYLREQNKPLGLGKPPLTPIKENENATITNLPPPSRNLDDPDNNIMFLDNGNRVVNPVNAKTPPPPLWGEILEEENYDPNEEFYDHSKAEQEMRRRKLMEEKRAKHHKKLKRKVVYVYEDDDEEEKNAQSRDQKVAQSMDTLQRLPSHQRMSSHKFQYVPALAQSNRRGVSSEMRMYNQGGSFQGPQDSDHRLPKIQPINPSLIQKPPLAAAQQNPYNQHQNVSSGRQIRTGGFSKLPTIMNTLGKPQ